MNSLIVQLKNEVMCRTLEFLTDDPSIKVGDHIISPDFSGEMVVTGVTQAYSEYTDSGLHRRILRICKLNGKPYTKLYNNETKTIEISYQDAKEWYKKGGILKELAIKAFDKEELATCQETINNLNLPKAVFRADPLDYKYLQYTAYIKALAERENGCWDKEGPKYCIVYTIPESGLVHPVYGLGNGMWVVRQEQILYPGVIYFKTAEIARKVYNLVPELFEGLLK